MASGNGRDPALQLLIDKQEIHEVLMRYFRGIDRCDEELVCSVYHPDGYDDHGDIFRGNGWEFAKWVVPMMKKDLKATTHFAGNELIEVRGDVAFAETYVIARHRMEIGGKDHLDESALRYIDRLERRDGEWKIAHRTCIREWKDVHALNEGDRPSAQMPVGERSRNDPSYRR